MGYPTLTYQCEDGIATIALTVPEKRNAISSQMVTDLLRRARSRRTKDPRESSSSPARAKPSAPEWIWMNYSVIAKQTQQKNLEDARRISKLFYRLYSFPKPVIAAVNGAAIAGGCGIATLADFTLAVPEAKFGYTEVRLGFMPAMVAVFLRHQIADRHVRDLAADRKNY